MGFSKVLIANRGEIALRINRACHELGLSTVAVYSTADQDSLHVKFADESVCIGPPSPKESYLNHHAILSAAEVTQADAIHPGYGFLAENSDFARSCQLAEIEFIGPSPEVIEKMGNKIIAKEMAKKAGVPLLPGFNVLDGDGRALGDDEILKRVEEIGYPVIIKAALGGGGRGMKLVESKEALLRNLDLARTESEAAFGSGEVYIEKFAKNPRHIEIQVLADKFGNGIHLGERECSLQRRHQKILEEAPSPFLDEETRKKMGETAVALTKEVDYHTVGTVEFIVDDKKGFYFLEMNTRIQVEHPISEMVTGVDLVREQIKMAQGKKLERSQEDIKIRGHSIECRILAEDPVTFAPSPGRIELFHPPMGLGVRLESIACSDFNVSPFYDSMVAKLIVHDETRDAAIEKMKEALREFVIRGIKTTIPLHLDILAEDDFVQGNFDTSYLARRLK